MAAQTSIRLLYLGRNKKLRRQIGDSLQQSLHQRGMEVGDEPNLHFVTVTNQKQALDEIREAPPHGVLVEVDDGRYTRSSFCQTLRSRLPRSVIVAVHKDSLSSDFAFDGYIHRPFRQNQAQEALTKLLDGGQGMYLQVGNLRLDVAMSMVDGPRGEQHLPPKLCKLLQVLMENAGATVHRHDLMQRVWETKFLGDTRTLDVHVRWLREKIEPDPSAPVYLLTVRGEGYRLNG